MELSIEGITKKYDHKTVLEDISHRFQAGSITGVLGENGAGKTTLLRIISGISKPDAGCVKIEDQDITGIVSSHMGVLLGGEVSPYANRYVQLLWRFNHSRRNNGWRKRKGHFGPTSKLLLVFLSTIGLSTFLLLLMMRQVKRQVL